MVKIEVDPKFRGPTAAELEPVLGDIKDNPVKVRWEGLKDEVRVLSNQDRDFVVFVSDMGEMAYASCALGVPLKIDGKEMEKGRDALVNRKAYNWKKHSTEVGPAMTRALVVKLAADAIRQGFRPKLAVVAADILQGRASPVDADVLVRTRK